VTRTVATRGLPSLLALLAGCGSGFAGAPVSPAPVAPAVAPVAPAVTAAPPCLPSGEPWLDASWYADGVAELCVGGESMSCFAFDLATRALSPVEAPTDEARVTRATPPGVERLDASALAAAGHRHTLCAPGGAPCKEVALSEGHVQWRSFSADGSMVVYSVAPSEDALAPGRRRHAFVVFATATGRLLGRHVFKDDSLLCGGARFVGDLLLVSVDVCAGPGGEAWFMDPRSGRRLGDVGGEGPFGAYQPSVWLREADVVVLEQTGTRLSVHDRRSGALLRVVDLVPGGLPTEPYGNGIFPLPGGDALVTLTGASVGTLLVIDGASLTVRERIEAPRCRDNAPP
jgi:hypothetical protein